MTHGAPTGARTGQRWDTACGGAIVALLLLLPATALHAEPMLRDPNLPSVPPAALQRLSDNRVRQQIMTESQAPYAGRCVCAAQAEDSNGRSCKGRYETISTRPRPLCRPGDVSQAMINAWRRQHP